MKPAAVLLASLAGWAQTTRSVWDGVYTEAQAKRGAALVLSLLKGETSSAEAAPRSTSMTWIAGGPFVGCAGGPLP